MPITQPAFDAWRKPTKVPHELRYYHDIALAWALPHTTGGCADTLYTEPPMWRPVCEPGTIRPRNMLPGRGFWRMAPGCRGCANLHQGAVRFGNSRSAAWLSANHCHLANNAAGACRCNAAPAYEKPDDPFEDNIYCLAWFSLMENDTPCRKCHTVLDWRQDIKRSHRSPLDNQKTMTKTQFSRWLSRDRCSRHTLRCVWSIVACPPHRCVTRDGVSYKCFL